MIKRERERERERERLGGSDAVAEREGKILRGKFMIAATVQYYTSHVMILLQSTHMHGGTAK